MENTQGVRGMYQVIDSFTGKIIGKFKGIRLTEAMIKRFEKRLGTERFYYHKVIRSM